MTRISEAHAATAARFSDVVENVTDWDAPTPVKEWTARDVVGHLTSWLPGLLGASGVMMQAGPSAAVDPVGAWQRQRAEVQRLLDVPALAEMRVAWPGGEKSVAEVIGEFYEPDVFMHAWDLARSNGIDFHLDEARCQEMVAGMTQAEEMLRASGQFGELVEVPTSASAEERLIGLIGRDPYWSA